MPSHPFSIRLPNSGRSCRFALLPLRVGSAALLSLATLAGAQSGNINWHAPGEVAVGCTGSGGSTNTTADGVSVSVSWSEFTNGVGGGGSLPGEGTSAILAAGCDDNDNFVTDTDAGSQVAIGGLTNFFLMSMGPGDDNRTDGMQLVVTFDPPLINLSFTLADIDVGDTASPPNNWRDLIRVEARDDTNTPVFGTATIGDGGSTADNTVAQTTSALLSCQASQPYRCYRGQTNNNSPNSEQDGNVALTFGSGNVASITITYLADDINGSDPTGQFVAVGAFSWTDTLPVVITSVDSERAGSETLLRWTTEFEALNAGFRVLGLQDGQWRELELVSSQDGDSRLPLRYEVAVPGEYEQLAIEDLDVQGHVQRHGPFHVGRAYGDEPRPKVIDWKAVKAASNLATPLERVREAAALSADPDRALARIATAARKGKGKKNNGNGGEPLPGARLLVSEAGIQKITYETLLASGVDLTGVFAKEIAVTDGGRAVRRYVGGPNFFGPGSWIEFVAEPETSPWSPVDVFLLTVDKKHASKVQTVSTHGRAGTAVQTATFLHDDDRRYSPASPNGDPFYDAAPQARPNAPASLERSFELPDLQNGSARLVLRLWGGADHSGSEPDHHVKVLVNGVELGDHRFDGITARSFQYDVSGLLLETGNTLRLELPGDTGFPFDIVHFDRFEVDYPRVTVAHDGRFEGKGATSGYTVEGLAGAAIGWMAHGSAAYRFEANGASPAQVPGWRSGAKIWVVEPGAEAVPGIVPEIPEPEERTSAEYVVITHPAFVAALDDLVALERARGFDVAVVTTDRIYAAYSDHQEHPDAIFRFLASSAARGGARYVLLVGGTTYDPYDHLGLGSVSFVPTQYVELGIVRFSPSDEPLVDFDRDGVPDAAIGRLPVRTPAELQAVIEKLWAYAPAPEALLTSGASEIAGQLPQVNLDYADAIGAWSRTTSDVDTLGAATVTADILAAFGPTGPSLVSFVGHSSPGRWDFTPVLRWQDVSTMTNQGRPVFVTQWGCWNAYYVAPDIEDMSTNLLLHPEVGAVGAIGATTLTNEASHQTLGATFFAAIGGGAETVGEAWLAAKRALATSGAPLDALYGMALLGDPATPLPPLDVVKSLPQSVWTRSGSPSVVRQRSVGTTPLPADDRRD